MQLPNITNCTYKIWRDRNPDIFPWIDANKLANQRRFIIANSKLTDIEMMEVARDVRWEVGGEREAENKTTERKQCSRPNEDNGDPATEEDVDLVTDLQDLSMNLSGCDLATVMEVNIEDSPDSGNDRIKDMGQKILSTFRIVVSNGMSQRKKIKKITNIFEASEQIALANRALQLMTANITLDLSEINQLLYAVAGVVAGDKEIKTQKAPKGPRWQERLQRAIDDYRSDLATVREFRKGSNTSQRIRAKVAVICDSYQMDMTQLLELDQLIVMKLQAKAQRLRRYRKRSEQFHHNRMFTESRRRLYQQLRTGRISVLDMPKVEEIEGFWADTLEREIEHTDHGEWRELMETGLSNIKGQKWKCFERADLTAVLGRMANWTAPGLDRVENFWIKKITSLHGPLIVAYNEVLSGLRELPEWMTNGTTYLIPKNTSTRDPKNFRPLTCLPTMYKALTAMVADAVYEHCSANDLIPEEQKGCGRGSRGCKDQLLISQMIMRDVRKRRGNIVVAWIDYKKAFDSVPHSWIRQMMSLFKIDARIVTFLENSMTNWRTTMWLTGRDKTISTRSIAVRRGIFQGDSLSPLLFCLALVPLTGALRHSCTGYVIENVGITHLLYMDDLKLFAASREEMDQCLGIVKRFSDDIQMTFGLDKCSVLEIKQGRLQRCDDLALGGGGWIGALNAEDGYKYLGFQESSEIHHGEMRTLLKKEYFARLRMILRTQLHSKNKCTAINSLAVPVLTYSFGVIQWTQGNLKNLDRKTRKILNKEFAHHSRASCGRLYIARPSGGRGLTEIETSYKQTIVGLADYLSRVPGKMMDLVRRDDQGRGRYSLQDMSSSIKDCYSVPRTTDGDSAARLKTLVHEKKLSTVQSKPLHGRYFQELNSPGIDKRASLSWLTWGCLKMETEGLILSAQDQALATGYHRRKIWKQQVNSKCRLCHVGEETVSHIIAGCSVLAPTEYLKRHNNVAGYIHWGVCRAFNVPVTDKYYRHVPSTIINKEENVIIMWDAAIFTDRAIPANRPDIVILNKKQKTCMLVEVSVPDDGNVLIKESHKKLKYKDLEIEIQRMWKVTCCTVPVVVGALGLLGGATMERIREIPGAPSSRMIQKIALLGTAHILRRVLG